MLIKLLKYEFAYMFKIAGLFYALTALVTLSMIILSNIDITNNDLLSQVAVIALILYVTNLIALGVGCFIIPVIRFYKNLFSSQGYLSFTIPVTPTQQLLAKFITSFTMIISTYIVIMLSISVFFATAPSEITYYNTTGVEFDFVKIFVAVIVLSLIATASTLICLYAVFSIGQRFRSKIGASIVAYIIYYVIGQILHLAVLVHTFTSNASTFMYLGQSTYLDVATIADQVIGLYTELLYYLCIPSLALGIAGFIIARHNLNKKLNLV